MCQSKEHSIQAYISKNVLPKTFSLNFFFEKYHLDLHVHVHKRPQSWWGRIGTHTIWTWLENKNNPAQLAISKHKLTVSHRLTVTINFIYECSWTWEYKLKSNILTGYLLLRVLKLDVPPSPFSPADSRRQKLCVDATMCKSKITLYICIALFNPDVQARYSKFQQFNNKLFSTFALQCSLCKAYLETIWGSISKWNVFLVVRLQCLQILFWKGTGLGVGGWRSHKEAALQSISVAIALFGTWITAFANIILFCWVYAATAS